MYDISVNLISMRYIMTLIIQITTEKGIALVDPETSEMKTAALSHFSKTT